MVIIYHLKSKASVEYIIFVGVDQFENEDLIKYSQKYMERLGDILMWYHADQYSSPHAYVRLHEGETTVPPELAEVCCQICKEGSIKGCKVPAIDIVFTQASNLAKTKAMNPGQVSFHRPAECGYLRGIRRNATIIKNLEKIRADIPLTEMEAELEDLVRQKRAKQAAADTRNPPKEEVNQKCAQRKEMLDGMTQADNAPANEDDFM